MKKRDKNKERKEILSALAMITQIGLSMITCMGISFAIGWYIDRVFGTKFWVMIMLLIGIMASIRSLFVLTGRLQMPSEKSGDMEEEPGAVAEEDEDERGKKDSL